MVTYNTSMLWRTKTRLVSHVGQEGRGNVREGWLSESSVPSLKWDWTGGNVFVAPVAKFLPPAADFFRKAR